MAADPYYVAAWDDPIGRLRAAQADAAHWKARALTAEAEVARMEAAGCSALAHDLRGGRIGARWIYRLLGVAA